MIVRQAVAADMPWILEQLHAFDQFFGSSRSLFPSMEQAELKLAFLIEHHVFLVADHGELQGFIAGMVGPSFFNDAHIYLTELFWWVAPEHRGSRAGLALLNAFVAKGKELADWVVMTLEAESPVNPETLTRRGFRPKETNYLLEVV